MDILEGIAIGAFFAATIGGLVVRAIRSWIEFRVQRGAADLMERGREMLEPTGSRRGGGR